MNRTFKRILNLTLTGLILASILPHILPNVWYIDIFAHFKIQYIILLVGLLILCLIKRKSKPIVFVLIIMLSWNSYFVIPIYYDSRDVIEKQHKSLSIASINLLSSNKDSKLVKNYIGDVNPDILVLLELNKNWEMALMDIISEYQYNEIVPRSDNFGIAILSKVKMETLTQKFGENATPSIIGIIELNNEPLTIIATHPVPPVGNFMFNNRNNQLKEIADKRNEFSENLIVIGDLNTSSYSYHFSQFVKQSKLKDSRNGYGVLASWPTNNFLIKTTLDHCLIGGNITVLDRKTGSNIGSDHLPIYIKIGI